MDYKATLHLPKTDFPMKANLAQAEPKMLTWWDEIGIYKRLRESAADRPLWILHDGPPYANGSIHMEFTSALPARIERLLSHLRHARSP